MIRNARNLMPVRTLTESTDLLIEHDNAALCVSGQNPKGVAIWRNAALNPGKQALTTKASENPNA